MPQWRALEKLAHGACQALASRYPCRPHAGADGGPRRQRHLPSSAPEKELLRVRALDPQQERDYTLSPKKKKRFLAFLP